MAEHQKSKGSKIWERIQRTWMKVSKFVKPTTPHSLEAAPPFTYGGSKHFKEETIIFHMPELNNYTAKASKLLVTLGIAKKNDGTQ